MAEQPDHDATAAPVPVAPGPHLKDPRHSTRRMMVDVLIALIPLMIASTIIFGYWTWIVTGMCVGFCILAEVLFAMMRRRRPAITDCSAIVTGVILALSLPWNTPWYVALVGSFIGIGLGKMVFGGVGFNIFNPAMVGRAFVMLSFAGAVGAPAYVANSNVDKLKSAMPWLETVRALPSQYAAQAETDVEGKVEAVSAATPMTAYKMDETGEKGGFVTKLGPLLLGNTIGSLGETSALACLIGGAYLLIRRTAAWQIPLGCVLAVGVWAGVDQLMNLSDPWGILHSIFGGALLFGAFFIATDPVTSPLTHKGKFIFGLGVGVFVMFIRRFSGYPEGVMFAVLLMNSLTPLINRWTVPKPLGGAVGQ
jgi:electron transport complex protein RnfD